ncbi:MAG: malectin domain-containing carbohydrate-binding protein [Acidobacteriota bacterium]
MKPMLLLIALLTVPLEAGTTLDFYFGHQAVADRHGVIAPWYKGQNGQYDYRVRVAAETLKRYPWAMPPKVLKPAPEYVYSGHWNIDDNGTIMAIADTEWMNGDLGQRAAFILGSLIDYYQYTGDPASFAPITLMADYLTTSCQTPPTHAWPNMLISVPTMGTVYGPCKIGTSDTLKDRHGKIQLDTVGEIGLELVRAYELTGNVRWYEAAKRWADLLAANRRKEPGVSPWGRYANNARGTGMNGPQNGTVAMILLFFDELIRTGYSGPGGSIVAARDAGRAYLRDIVLPNWTVRDAWGRNFWDWECHTADLYGAEFSSLYLMQNKDYFENWERDARNILSLFVHMACVNPASKAEVYHGAWAYPESTSCCSTSLWYSTLEIASVFARYAVEADSEWAREIARRSGILATYDPKENGQTMDALEGGVIVNKDWFKIAHPMALRYVLRLMAWLPEIAGANRENHIMRSSGVVRRVTYDKGKVAYSTFDAPARSIDVLRLSFTPLSVTANGRPLSLKSDAATNGYQVKPLPGGDCIVSIRHDNATDIVVEGPDPQKSVEAAQMTFTGSWAVKRHEGEPTGDSRVSNQAGATAGYQFVGNQVRVIGSVGETGGLAEVYLDNVRQLVPIDCYSPVGIGRQVLYWRNGLENGTHTLKIVVRGEGNPVAKGRDVMIDGIQSSDAAGDSGFGEGGGPTGAQRFAFGLRDRQDYVDKAGKSWKPGLECIVRTGNDTDVVTKAWMTDPWPTVVESTADPMLFRHWIYGKEIILNVTVGPGTYDVNLRFADNEVDGPGQRTMTVDINGETVAQGLDAWAKAGARATATDVVFKAVKPKNGAIAIRLTGEQIAQRQCDAFINALEVTPAR